MKQLYRITVEVSAMKQMHFINPEKLLVSSNQFNLLTKGKSHNLTLSYTPPNVEPGFTQANVLDLIETFGQTGNLTEKRVLTGPQRCPEYHYEKTTGNQVLLEWLTLKINI